MTDPDLPPPISTPPSEAGVGALFGLGTDEAPGNPSVNPIAAKIDPGSEHAEIESSWKSPREKHGSGGYLKLFVGMSIATGVVGSLWVKPISDMPYARNFKSSAGNKIKAIIKDGENAIDWLKSLKSLTTPLKMNTTNTVAVGQFKIKIQEVLHEQQRLNDSELKKHHGDQRIVRELKALDDYIDGTKLRIKTMEIDVIDDNYPKEIGNFFANLRNGVISNPIGNTNLYLQHELSNVPMPTADKHYQKVSKSR